MNTKLKIKDDLIDQVLGNKSLLKENQIMIFSKPYLAEIIYDSLKKEGVKEGRLFLLPHSETLPYDFFSSSTNFLLFSYPSMNFFAFVTLKLKFSFLPSKHKAFRHIAISKA